MKKWETIGKFQSGKSKFKSDEIIEILLKNRGLTTKKEIETFLHPPDPQLLTPDDVGIDKESLKNSINRLSTAVKNKESVVVYADYDADGITAGSIMWETLYRLGARAMPYIPHRVEEGYGLSTKGIDTVIELYHPTLIITVDHGVTANEKVEYARKMGIEVIVTDHHVKPKILPSCLMVHTTKLCGAGISWFVAKELISELKSTHVNRQELISLAAIGTIADMVPLVGPNRSIAKYGLAAINKTKRIGLAALISEAGLKGNLGTYDISHIIAPRLNAMGRLEHAMDALRLLCTNNKDQAAALAQKIGLTNKERQQLTSDTTAHAFKFVKDLHGVFSGKRLLFVAHESYNQGIIGLVAGKLVEEYYLPAIVIAKGDIYSKASARSITGFNIVEAIRSCSDILVDVGGHPMAAGFTVETKNLGQLQERLEKIVNNELDENKLTRILKIDLEIPLDLIDKELWAKVREFEPFGFGNTEPVFMTKNVHTTKTRLVGTEGKHLKLIISGNNMKIDAIAFGFGLLYGELKPDKTVDIAYTVDMNNWNGNENLQLKIKDIHTS